MTTDDFFLPHPVQLASVDFYQFFCQRSDFTGETPYVQPKLDLRVERSGVYEDTNGILIFEVKTKEQQEPNQDGKLPPFSFSCSVIATFTCAEFEGSEGLAAVFMDSDTPLRLAWPYVRAFVAEMIAKTGLPPFHMPLTQIRTGQMAAMVQDRTE